MKKLYAAIVLSSLLSVAIGKASTRVFGGSDASEAQYPYQVYLTWRGIFLCGGSIVDERYVLIAAHCLKGFDPKDLRITAGTNQKGGRGRVVYPVETFVIHESYDEKGKVGEPDNDIGLIRLTKDIAFTDKMKKIGLPSSDEDNFENSTSTLTGWGATSMKGATPSKLQQVQLRVIDNASCNKTWMEFKKQEIDETKICTIAEVGQGACFGDSGGPLAIGDTQIGVVSFGEPCATGLPDVFTRVSSYLDWINAKMSIMG